MHRGEFFLFTQQHTRTYGIAFNSCARSGEMRLKVKSEFRIKFDFPFVSGSDQLSIHTLAYKIFRRRSARSMDDELKKQLSKTMQKKIT